MRSTGRSRFIGNTASLVVATGSMAVLTLIQVKVLAAFLPRETFGLFAALRGLSLLLAMLAANGLPQLLVRFLPAHAARGEKRRAVRLSAVCVAAAALLSAAVIAACSAFEGYLLRDVPAGDLHGGLRFWFYATTAGLALKLVLHGGLGGLRRFGWQTVIEVAGLALQVVWIATARESLTLTHLFRILGVVSLATVVATIPVFASLLRRDLGGPALSAPGESYAGYWLGATGLSVVAMAFSDADRFVLSRVLTLELLSLFHVGGRVIRLANRVLAMPLLAFQPEVTRLDAEHRSGDVERSTRVLIKLNICVSMLVAGLVIVYAPSVIRAVASGEYLEAVPLLMVMATTVPLSATTAPLTSLMKARNRISRAVVCDLVWAATYLVGLVALGRALGLVGAGLALVAACACQLATAWRLGDVRPARTVVVAPALRVVAAVSLAVVPAALAVWVAPTSWSLAAQLAALPVALLLFRFAVERQGVFDYEERDLVAAMLRSAGLVRLANWVVRT